MHLRHIVAATDNSEAGRDAARTAIDLANRSAARLTILYVAPHKPAPRHAVISIGGTGAESETQAAVAGLRRWLEFMVVEPGELQRIQLEAAVGLPGIEISRFAESRHADLVVLGRKHGTDMTRLLLGDTADAVARRSGVPTLFVPHRIREPGRVLVALDGSQRGLVVLQEACDFARSVRADLEVITIEGDSGREGLEEVGNRAAEMLAEEGFPGKQVAIREGDVVESVISHCLETQADVLAAGYHRGAAVSILGAGSTAQRLAHAAPCAVLTVPL